MIIGSAELESSNMHVVTITGILRSNTWRQLDEEGDAAKCSRSLARESRSYRYVYGFKDVNIDTKGVLSVSKYILVNSC